MFMHKENTNQSEKFDNIPLDNNKLMNKKNNIQPEISVTPQPAHQDIWKLFLVHLAQRLYPSPEPL